MRDRQFLFVKGNAASFTRMVVRACKRCRLRSRAYVSGRAAYLKERLRIGSVGLHRLIAWDSNIYRSPGASAKKRTQAVAQWGARLK